MDSIRRWQVGDVLVSAACHAEFRYASLSCWTSPFLVTGRMSRDGTALTCRKIRSTYECSTADCVSSCALFHMIYMFTFVDTGGGGQTNLTATYL